MITEKSIQEGLRKGYIKLIIDPNMESGTVCQIGDNWFYFGGMTAEDMSPEEFSHCIPEGDIVREIYETLDDFPKHEEYQDEYAYYDAFLAEQYYKHNRFGSIFANINNGKDAIAAAEKASSAVNSFCFRAKEEGDTIMQNEKLRNTMMPYAVAFVKRLALSYELTKEYDGRNEIACQRSSQIAASPQFKELSAQYDSSYALEFANAMVRQHRTLQQSFASLCLYLVCHEWNDLPLI